MSRAYFEGWYYKHRAQGRTLCLIPGRAQDGAFVQVITDTHAYHIPYPLTQYLRRKDCLYVGGNVFTPDGIRLDIQTPALSLSGALHYRNRTAIRGDIMGPFRFLPMECRHGVVSMRHTLAGSVALNGETLALTGGLGYIETDRGRSFPKSYAWVQANEFGSDCAIMASVANIPFCGTHFQGCICIVRLDGREYRLATYRGARILCCTPGAIGLRQGQYRLDVTIDAKEGCALSAPTQGAMCRIIRETAACSASFRFTKGNHLLFEGRSDGTSHEYVPEVTFVTV